MTFTLHIVFGVTLLIIIIVGWALVQNGRAMKREIELDVQRRKNRDAQRMGEPKMNHDHFWYREHHRDRDY